MIIINADDWGRSVPDTDAAANLARAGRVTSVSAMVFMADSSRAARLADEIGVDVGLHVNFCESFDGSGVPAALARQHASLVRFFGRGRYAQLVYNVRLRRAFKDLYWAQVDEFHRLYRREPSHIDGHRHLHLSMNMVVDGIIPKGCAVRRSFTFAAGEKSGLNRMFRRFVDGRLERRYVVADAFYSIEHWLKPGRSLGQLADVANSSDVEVMTHPRRQNEFDYLASDDCGRALRAMATGTYAQLLANARTATLAEASA